tara:strand:- start:521 stop:1039 length:519 start_codon:yes stop_codon:yes gene_type:complete
MLKFQKIIIYTFLLSLSLLYSHPVVEDLDLNRFMGRWYVIALVPNWVEENCTNSYDDYVLNEDNTIDITYRAIKNGKSRMIKQKGIVSKESSARWEIEFVKPWVPLYKAPYEVIILDENYEFMVVGYPDNTFGWIMARGTSMNNDIYDNILETLERDFGYSKETFQKVIHKN